MFLRLKEKYSGNLWSICTEFASDPPKQKSYVRGLVHMHGLYKSRSGTISPINVVL